MANIILKTTAGRFATLAGGLVVAVAVWMGLGGAMKAAPPVPEDITCLPTCSMIDARFLVVAGEDPTTLGSEKITVGLSFENASGEANGNFALFDADRDVANWDTVYTAPDLSTAPAPELIVELIADPTGVGGRDGTDPVLATWTPGAIPGGIEQGPFPNPASQNNQWQGVSFVHDAAALSGANHRYAVRIKPANPGGDKGWNTFKVRTAGTVLLLGNQIVGFIASLNQNDRPTVYPSYNPADPLNTANFTPTTYDGTWSFKTNLAPAFLGDVTVFDGDMDFGNAACAYRDQDDPDSDPANPNSDFFGDGIPGFATGSAAVGEGIATSGNCSNPANGLRSGTPPDDNEIGAGAFKRVPTIPGSTQGIAYQLVAPDGQIFVNRNPTGQREWEQFKIQLVYDAADLGIGGETCPDGGFEETPGFTLPDDPFDESYPASDCRTLVLPGGAWEIQLDGMDMNNLNFWYFTFKVSPINTDYHIGRLVWYDDNKNGIQDDHAGPGDTEECLPGVLCASEPGIPGVLIDLFENSDLVNAIRPVYTTDADGEINPGGPADPQGVLPAGKYRLIIRPSNLAAGGALEGWASTNGGETSPAPDAGNGAIHNDGIEVGLPICTDTNIPAGCADPIYDEWNFGYAAESVCIVTTEEGDTFVGAIHSFVDNPGIYFGDPGYITVRTTLNAERFVDNTYGSGAIGWGSKGHTFGNLVGSDHVQLSLYDDNDVKQMEFKLDYITSSSTPGQQGYDTLGIAGGEGKFLFPTTAGASTNIVDVDTSLAKNFRDPVMTPPLTVNSPPTDASYTPPVGTYHNWIYQVYYDVTFKVDLFVAGGGYGYARVSGVHASPSKTGNNTEVCVYEDGTTGPIPPSATPDFYEVTRNHDKSVSKPGVLKNDTAGPGGAITAVLVTGPTNGIFINTGTLNADGSFKYRPNTNFIGDDTFTYKASNANGFSNVATVTIKVKK